MQCPECGWSRDYRFCTNHFHDRTEMDDQRDEIQARAMASMNSVLKMRFPR